MSIKLKKVIILFLLIGASIQIYLNNILIKKIETIPVKSDVIQTEYKSLSQLNSELSDLNNSVILSADKEEDRWYVELELFGDKQEILSEMKKLEKYEVRNYVIRKNDKENCVIIDIYGRKDE
ncbi:hypothetical protein [uncultured Clostridium sp.]|uniref:hypothetical protein n=1 Tax=uncultured Clostridium sp. TaxID=59620 RepID=UPI0025E962BE|nr:hypothetical protein [uncultured Clostridium sp.]